MTMGERIASLEAEIRPLEPQDTMPEAGRKAMLREFAHLLKHEAGCRTGENIEAVHDMRVATRRLRSAFRLLRRYYRAKATAPYRRRLRKLAQALGAVRDLDVLIANLEEFRDALDGEDQAGIQPIIERLENKRASAREELNELFDGKSYRRFVRDFSAFLTTPGEGAKTMDTGDIVPIQVRHVLPSMVHDCMGAVLAYDAVLGDADAGMLHALRIEFKRLRYLISLFEDVLGTQTKGFIAELKRIQDHLGRLHDIMVAQEYLDAVSGGEQNGHVPAGLALYGERLSAEAADLLASFPAVWARFNSRKVQSKLSSGLLALR
jgi:CHAD domain-containing protein